MAQRCRTDSGNVKVQFFKNVLQQVASIKDVATHLIPDLWREGAFMRPSVCPNLVNVIAQEFLRWLHTEDLPRHELQHSKHHLLKHSF